MITTATPARIDNRRQEVQTAIKTACDQLNSVDGVSPRDYVEQLAWMFFLKAFDEMETEAEEKAQFEGKSYERRLKGQFRWSAWTQTKDYDEMLEFVDGKLWKKLTSPDPKIGMGEDAVGERFRRVFGSVRNHSRRGASFARVVQQVNKLHFSDETDVVILSEIYESLLKQVAQDAAGYAGEFYTQRHIVRLMVEVVKPKLGDRVYDPCSGTGGFLAEAADYIRRHAGNISEAKLRTLHSDTFYGIELKALTYLLGVMNMILHRIDSANLEQENTLERHEKNTPEKNKYDVILSNPPFGGKMDSKLATNFTVRSGSTEVLFVQHMMTNLAKGGRCAVVAPEGVLFRGGPDAKVREKLLTEFNVHTVLSLPAGCFLPYTGVKTNVLFFDRPKDGSTTKDVWFYEMTNDGFELKQTRRPMEGGQIADFLAKQPKRTVGDNSWLLPLDKIRERGWDLSAKNPNRKDDYEHRPALELVQSIRAKEDRIIELLDELEGMLER